MHAPLLLLALGLAPQDKAAPAPDVAVTRDELAHHVAVLASEELRGRQAGTPGAVAAAQYLARSLEEAGLEPGASDGFLQPISLIRVEYPSAPRLTLIENDGTTYEALYGRDFNFVARGRATTTGELALRRVTRRNEMPDEVRDDEAILFRVGPKIWKEWIVRLGASDAAGFGLEVQLTDNEQPGVPKGPPPSFLVLGPEEEGCEKVMLRGEARTRVLWKGVRAVRFEVDEVRSEIRDYNVVGVLPGQDPQLAREAVLLTASYDHTGVGEDGTVLGGANAATGAAALLEIAQALAAEPPARTVVFLFATGSQLQRLGTRHYIEHPTVPLDETVACLGVKRLGIPDDEPGGPMLTGFERTNLGEAFQEHGVAIVADPEPKKRHLFQRFETYPFALEGVVAQGIVGSRKKAGDDHGESPADLDQEHLFMCVQTLYDAVRLLADGTVAPSWRPDGKPRKP